MLAKTKPVVAHIEDDCILQKIILLKITDHSPNTFVYPHQCLEVIAVKGQEFRGTIVHFVDPMIRITLVPYPFRNVRLVYNISTLYCRIALFSPEIKVI